MTEAASARREARLRPEFADFHAQVAPGSGCLPRIVGERVMEYASTADHLGLYPRPLDSRHFEFRGGESTAARPLDALTRAYDQ